MQAWANYCEGAEIADNVSHLAGRIPGHEKSGVSRTKGKSFQELTDEAFADLLKKHKQPVGLKAALT